MRLDKFGNNDFDRGASPLKELLWLICSGMLVTSWVPGSRWRVSLLRSFGATIGEGVVIKPEVKIKFPWRIVIGDHCWFGERVWIDNLATVTIGNHVCISQYAYLCTGSHNWNSESFELECKPILVEDKAWIGAFARIAPGAILREGAVLALGSVANGEFNSWGIYRGNPATEIRRRERPSVSGSA